MDDMEEGAPKVSMKTMRIKLVQDIPHYLRPVAGYTGMRTLNYANPGKKGFFDQDDELADFNRTEQPKTKAENLLDEERKTMYTPVEELQLSLD
jgi:hypothetical protein